MQQITKEGYANFLDAQIDLTCQDVRCSALWIIVHAFVVTEVAVVTRDAAVSDMRSDNRALTSIETTQPRKQ